MGNKQQRQRDNEAAFVERQAKERLRIAEATRSEMEAQLGTYNQAYGQGSFGETMDPRLMPYLQRSTWDEELGGNRPITLKTLGINESTDPDIKEWQKQFKEKEKQKRQDYLSAKKAFVSANPGDKEALKQWELENTPQKLEEGREYLKEILSQVSELESEAQAAAASGDYASAESLINQRKDLTSRFGSVAQQAFVSYDDPALKARFNLMSPTAKGIGRLMWTAKQLQSPDSEEYKSLQENITRDPLEALRLRSVGDIRNVVARHRSMGRQLLETDMASGAARFANRNLALRGLASMETAGQISGIQDELGTQQSQLLSRASQWLQKYSTGLAGGAAKLGQGFLNNSPGVNADYLNTLSQYDLAETNILGSAGSGFKG